MRGSQGSFLTYLLAGALIFSFGYARAVWVRARRDYRTTKAAVKPLRRAKWKAIRHAIALGAVVVVVGFVLGVWVYEDAKGHANDHEVPASVVSPSKGHK